MIRVAVLDLDRCQPEKCGIPCVNFCPPVKNGIEAIKISENSFPTINESLCIGCGICVSKCPFEVISIVNLPRELETDIIHQYGVNSFRLYRLPFAEKGKVTGIIGRNGIGKSTALSILAGQLKPNLGKIGEEVNWEEAARYFRGSLIQEYFVNLARGSVRISFKPQQVDSIPKIISGSVGQLLYRLGTREVVDKIVEKLELTHLLNRDVKALSGGELQRLAIAAALIKGSDILIFDEPSSFLDVKQRTKVASIIREAAGSNKRIIVCDHDLTILDYVSDNIFIFYGEPSVYGVVSGPYSTREGINTYLEGYLPLENVRFRDYKIVFQTHIPKSQEELGVTGLYWPAIKKSYDGFKMFVEPGHIEPGNVLGILGPNGIGKTTFIKMLVGADGDGDGKKTPLAGYTVSYKPQYIATGYSGEVQELLSSISPSFGTDHFENEFVKPLSLRKLLDRDLKELSGGELQRVAIAVCLARQAQIYLLDEPSAYLDVEERLTVAKMIRRVAEERGAFIFVVEHDIVTQDFVADRLMIFEGEPGVHGEARKPVSLREGMNVFLSRMRMTFRRDPESGRPRVNKAESRLDRAQREIGEHYYAPSTHGHQARSQIL
ncbi:MAG: ribosome biogenesis/translation initiation ATPase RLI [Candidatus Bathyarchaeia archaeon]